LFVMEREFGGFPRRMMVLSAADPLLVAVAWFAFSVGPMLGVANFGYHAFADRFTYIPAIGFSIVLLGVGLFRKARALEMCLLSIIVVALAVRTWYQTDYWENDGKLFQHTVDVDGEQNSCAHVVLARWYWEVPHDVEKCVAEFEKAEKQNFFFAHDSFELYIFALCELGRTERIPEILSLYEQSLIDRFGKDVWMQAWTSQEDRGPANHYRHIYRIAKAARWLTDLKSLPLVEEFIEETQSEKSRRDSVWLYLNWKFSEAKHGTDSPESIAARETLSKHGARDGYVQFRYLRDDPLPRYKP